MGRMLRLSLDDRLYERVSEHAENQGLTIYHYVRRAVRMRADEDDHIIEIEEEIEKVRHGCNDCCLRDNCIIAYAVGSIVERSEKDYEVLNTLLSLCRGKLLCSYWYPENEDEDE